MSKELEVVYDDDMEPVFSVGDPVIDNVSGKSGTVTGRLSDGHFVVRRSDGPVVTARAEQLTYNIHGFVYVPDVEKVARILMKSMGCQIQSDEADCDEYDGCSGHEQFTYCAVHDWEDDWMDWDQGRLCLFARKLATDLVKEGVR